MTIFAGDAPALDRRDILDIPAEGGVFGAAFEEAFTTNPSTAIYRMEDLTQEQEGRAVVMGPESYFAPNQARLEPDSPLMSAQDARDKVDSLGLKLTVPDQGIRTGALDVLIKRQQEQLARQQVLARAGSSFGTQLSAGLAASILDPINIASAFVPVVGEARYAAMLGRAATPLARAGVRAGVGALEGAVGAAIIEPLPLLAARQDQTDYDLSDSLANIAFGAALGGGLHTIGGAVSDRLRRNIATETDVPPGGLGAGQVAEPIESISARSPSLATFDRAFDADPITALKGTLARQAEYDSGNTMRGDEKLPRSVSDKVSSESYGDWLSRTANFEGKDYYLKDGTKVKARLVDEGDGSYTVQLASGGENVGSISAVDSGDFNPNIEVSEGFRRRGAATLLYDLATENGLRIGSKENPNALRTKYGELIREAYEPGQSKAFRYGGATVAARVKTENADWKTRESALKTAVSQAVTGRDIDVQHIFDLEDPSKAMMASESIRKGAPRSPDQIANNDSLRADDIVKSQKDDLDQAQADFDEEQTLSTEMLKQLPEADRAAVEKAASAEIEASNLQAQKAEQYAKAYNAAAICDLRNGV
jgi:Uncharacterized membrane protein, putative virulence factor